MTLDLNQLHVESFQTDDSPELIGHPGRPTHDVILCAEQDEMQLMAPTPPYKTCGCTTG